MKVPSFLKNLIGKSTSTNTKQAASVQGWIPIRDIDQFHMLRQDQIYVSGIRMYPKNIDLLSKRELHHLIHNLQDVVNGFHGHFQYFSAGRPVDLDGYIDHLENMKEQTKDPIRKKILQSQIKQAAETAISGEALETLFYMLFALPNKSELMDLVKQVVTDLINRGLNGYILDHKELMDMNFIFTHPTQAAYERMPEDTRDYIPPQLLNPERARKHG